MNVISLLATLRDDEPTTILIINDYYWHRKAASTLGLSAVTMDAMNWGRNPCTWSEAFVWELIIRSKIIHSKGKPSIWCPVALSGLSGTPVPQGEQNRWFRSVAGSTIYRGFRKSCRLCFQRISVVLEAPGSRGWKQVHQSSEWCQNVSDTQFAC
jgi:hypothetical protein